MSEYRPKYFSVGELTASATAKAKGIDNRPTEEVRLALLRLCQHVLDPLREAYGKPITVNSGYRCPALNRAVGGAATSQHVKGEAADITGGSKSENKRLWELVRRLNLPFDQCIDEKNFTWIHISYGPRHRRQFLKL